MNGVTDIILGFVLGIVSGIIVGIVIQTFWYKRSLRIEKTKRVAPYLENVFDIVDMLKQDVEYVKKIQDRREKRERKAILAKISTRLNQYHTWYVEFKGNGLIPELRSLNEELHNHLNGLYVLADTYGGESNILVHQALNDLSKTLEECRRRLERHLMG